MKIIIFTAFLFFLFATPAHAQVVISEVYPAPTSEENEWIELYNTSDEEIDISNWKLYEHFSKESLLINFEDTTIKPNEFYVYELNSNKLNNTEEKVSLANHLGEQVSELHYQETESQKSISYLFKDNSKIGQTLQITQPTKKLVNQIEITNTPTPTPTSTPSPTPTNTPEPEKKEEIKEIKKEVATPTPINYELIRHQKINQQLSFPILEKTPKEGLQKRVARFSYIVQKKVSKSGVINAIIGGSLIIFAGLLIWKFLRIV